MPGRATRIVLAVGFVYSDTMSVAHLRIVRTGLSQMSREDSQRHITVTEHSR